MESQSPTLKLIDKKRIELAPSILNPACSPVVLSFIAQEDTSAPHLLQFVNVQDISR